MLKKRNAQGMSLKVIIVAILGLIILTIIVMMLTGKLGDFRSDTKSFGNIAKKCTEQEGTLKEKHISCDPGEGSIASSDSIAEDKKCCRSGGYVESGTDGGGGTQDGGLFGIGRTEDIQNI